MADNIKGMKTGFVLDKDGNRILPITHMSLIIGNDGQTIFATIEEQKAFIDANTVAIAANAESIAANAESIANVDNRVTEVDGKVSDASNLITDISSRIDSVKSFANLPVNESLVEGSIRYVIDDQKYYSYTAANGWKEMTTSGQGGYIDDTYSHIWIGTEPPEDNDMLWLDTNTDGIVEEEEDANLLRMVLEQMAEMKNEIASLRRRVKYLEEHGTFDPGAGDDDNPETPEDEDDIILLEDGTSILLEDESGELLLEIQIDDSVAEDPDEIILLEDGTPLSLEDDSGDILMEIQIENAPSKPNEPEEEVNAILLEDGIPVLLEDGKIILLESNY